MKHIILITSLLSLGALSSQAATTFQAADADNSNAPNSYTVDGITMTIISSTGTLLTENAGSGWWGVDDGNGTNVQATQNKRVYSAESIFFSFDTAVTLDGIAFNNQGGHYNTGAVEIASLTSNGSGFDGLTYTDLGLIDTVYSLHTWGYNDTTDSFAIEATDLQNNPDYLLFGTGDNSVITLATGEVITFTVPNVNASGGGIGLHGIQVTAIPEPSSSALLGLGGLALILSRRK